MKPIRVAVVQTHPIQYFSPLWRGLAAEAGFDVRVFYLSRQGADTYQDVGFNVPVRWDLPLLQGHDAEFVPNLPASATNVSGFWSLCNIALVGALRRYAPDVCVVHGYEHAAKWLAYSWCMVTRTPYVIRGESNNLRPRGFVKSALRWTILHPLYGRASAVAAIGRLNAAYSIALGTARDRVVLAPYSVDDQRFSAACDVPVKDARARFGLPGDGILILVSGKLIDRKQPLLALEAFRSIATDVPSAHLAVLGEGTLRPAIEREAARIGLGQRVHLLGFVNQTDVPLVYRACDFLVFPSLEDTWGLALNEAMHVGLPAIVSDRVGAAPDLIVEGETGFIVRADDVSGIANAMRVLASNDELRRRCGMAAQLRAAHWGMAATVRGMRDACELAASRPR